MNPYRNIKLGQTSASHALQVVNSNASKNLPGLATVNDIREVVQFLKRHEGGVTIVQALDSLRKRAFDPRKLEAYDSWGIVVKNGDRIRLSDLGWEIARLRAAEANIFRGLLTQNPIYWLTLEWIQQQELKLISYVELSSFWRESTQAGLQSASDEELESSAASFLQICHAADLGVLLVGRKGTPTRLHLYPDELATFVNDAGPGDVATFKLVPETVRTNFRSTLKPRVFINCASGTNSIKRLLEIFTLAAVDHEFAGSATVEQATTAANLDRMKHCDTAIIVLTSEAWNEHGDLSSQTLLELGAAVMHFKDKLVVLVQNGLSLPTDFPVTFHTFDGDLSWDLAVQILSFVKQID